MMGKLVKLMRRDEAKPPCLMGDSWFGLWASVKVCLEANIYFTFVCKKKRSWSHALGLHAAQEILQPDEVELGPGGEP